MIDHHRTIIVWDQGRAPIGTIPTTGTLRLLAHQQIIDFEAGRGTVCARLHRSQEINFLLTDDNPLAWRGVAGFIALWDERVQAHADIAQWIETHAAGMLTETSPVSATEVASTVALMQEMAATIRAMGAVRREDAA